MALNSSALDDLVDIDKGILKSTRVAEVALEHGWHPPKSLDSDENFKPEHALFCRELRFVAIYAFFLEVIFSEVGFYVDSRH